MLVLTRKQGEEIIIDGSIRVRIGSLQGNRVRLLIEAPAEVPIRRAELALDSEEMPEFALCESVAS